MTISAEQMDAVRKYVRDFDGEIQIKVAMLGQERVGKVCIIFRMNHDAFLVGSESVPMDSEGFSLRTYIEDKNIHVSGIMGSPPLDWSPMDWSDDVVSAYSMVRHCEASVFVYDVTNRESYRAVKWYYDNFQLERNLERPGCCGLGCCPCLRRPGFKGTLFVIANKIDRERAHWQVSTEEGEHFSQSIGAIFIPMSAETGEGSGSEAMLDIANQILWQRIQSMPDGNRKETFAEHCSEDHALRLQDSNWAFWN